MGGRAADALASFKKMGKIKMVKVLLWELPHQESPLPGMLAL